MVARLTTSLQRLLRRMTLPDGKRSRQTPVVSDAPSKANWTSRLPRAAAVLFGCMMLFGCTSVKETLPGWMADTMNAMAKTLSTKAADDVVDTTVSSAEYYPVQSDEERGIGVRPLPHAMADAKATEVEGKRIALVIGNGAYLRVPNLKNPVNDANDMARALRKMGFEVTKVINTPNKHALRNAVRNLSRKLRAGGTGLFYYSGHGMQVNGINYLIPTQVDLQEEADIDDQALSMNYVLQTLDDARNQMNIIILDACRNNPFARTMRSGTRGLGQTRGLARMDSPAGSLVAFATSPGDVAEDGSGRNGTYTKNLLSYIATPGISIEEMFKRVRIGVSRDTRSQQLPWESSSLTQEFCFAGCVNMEAVRADAERRARENMEQELKRLQDARREAERKAQEAKQKQQELQQLQDQAIWKPVPDEQVEQTATELERLRREAEQALRQAEHDRTAAEQARKALEVAERERAEAEKARKAAEAARAKARERATRPSASAPTVSF